MGGSAGGRGNGVRRNIGGGLLASACLGAIILAAVLAPWLAPLPPDLQEDVAGARYLPPLTRAQALRLSSDRVRVLTSLRATPAGWMGVRNGRREEFTASEVLGAPAPRFYLLGTDSLGRDLTSRLLFGTRHTLVITALSAILATFLGVAVGAVAGLGGRRWDDSLMRGVDVLRCMPRLLLVLVCASLFPPSTLLLVLILGATTWTGLARILRGQMRVLARSDLAAAARASGASPLRVALRHLLPQATPLLTVNAALRLADIILLESALSLLGIAAPPPAVSLGGVMASGSDALSGAWWIAAWPGLLIAGMVFALRSTGARFLRLPDPPSVA